MNSPLSLTGRSAAEQALQNVLTVPEAESEPDFMPDTAEKPETGISEDAPYRQFPSEPAEEPFGEEDAGPEYADGEEKPRRMGFLARFKKKSAPREDELPEEAQDGETPDEEPGEKRQSFFRSIFFRPRDEGEEDAESEDEPGSEKPEDKPAGAKISFFTRLSPEKEKFEALMRAKKEEEKPNVYTVGPIVLDEEKKSVTVDGDEVALTPIEFNILRLLMKNPGRIYSSAQIYELVWKEDSLGAETSVSVHIRHLRQKLEINPSEPRYLKVVWGLGYKMEDLRHEKE